MNQRINPKIDVLAFTGRPPDEPIEIGASELDDIAVVGDLLCSCAVGDGLILKEGWRYLVMKYGLNTILDIDNKNWEWFGNEKRILIENSKIGGYDPVTDQFGVWDDNSGFIPADS